MSINKEKEIEQFNLLIEQVKEKAAELELSTVEVSKLLLGKSYEYIVGKGTSDNLEELLRKNLTTEKLRELTGMGKKELIDLTKALGIDHKFPGLVYKPNLVRVRKFKDVGSRVAIDNGCFLDESGQIISFTGNPLTTNDAGFSALKLGDKTVVNLNICKLMAETFLEPIEGWDVVVQLDGRADNLSLENLAYAPRPINQNLLDGDFPIEEYIRDIYELKPHTLLKKYGVHRRDTRAMIVAVYNLSESSDLRKKLTLEQALASLEVFLSEGNK